MSEQFQLVLLAATGLRMGELDQLAQGHIVDDISATAALTDTDAEVLLREWYGWWLMTDEAPEKMPRALHVRTALFLFRAEMKARPPH